MIPVMQTIDKIPSGDCFRACVAAILEMKIDDVPHFCEGGDHEGKWFVAFRTWLFNRGMCVVTYKWGGDAPPQAMHGYCLVSVPSRHPDAQKGWLHSVVGRSELGNDGQLHLHIVHDPNSCRRVNKWDENEIVDVMWMVRVEGDAP